MDHVLNTVQTELSKTSGDNVVGGKGDTLATDLAVSSLVDELSGRNVGLDQSKHVDGGGVDLDENAVVDLSQSEQAKDLHNLRGASNDTANAHHENNLPLRRDKEGVVGLGLAARGDGSLLKLHTPITGIYNDESF